MDKALVLVKGFLENHLKSYSYFNERGEDGRKLDLKSVAAAGDGIKILFVVGETHSIHDPSIRKVARMAIEALTAAQPALADIKLVHDITS